MLSWLSATRQHNRYRLVAVRVNRLELSGLGSPKGLYACSNACAAPRVRRLQTSPDRWSPPRPARHGGAHAVALVSERAAPPLLSVTVSS
jgi:hypothetical protein